MYTFETTADFKAAIKEALQEELSLNVHVSYDNYSGNLSVEVEVWFCGDKVTSDKANDWIPQQ